MKIIQSLWTQPILKKSKPEDNSRFIGGWLEEKFHLASWVFSCMQLKKYYSKVELITDEFGKRLLIDELKLPYDEVYIELDILKDYSTQLWALGKIYSYGIQEEPFIHVDSDVYIWEKFSNRLIDAKLIAQNVEIDYPHYQTLFSQLLKNNFYIPKEMLMNIDKAGTVNAYNAGIIGGSNVAFFKMFSKEAFSFVDKNLSKLKYINEGRFNTIFEQSLYYCMSKVKDIPVQCYTENNSSKYLIKYLKDITRFCEAPKKAKLIHLYGEDCKQDKNICIELLNKVSNNYPEYYRRILKYANRII